MLATGYGQGPVSLGRRLRTQSDYAGSILSQFERAYPEVVRQPRLGHVAVPKANESALGWKMGHAADGRTPVASKNWPIQACAAEILKVAVVLAFQRALRVVGALHDALLVECRIEDLARTETVVREVMVEASRGSCPQLRAGCRLQGLRLPGAAMTNAATRPGPRSATLWGGRCETTPFPARPAGHGLA